MRPKRMASVLFLFMMACSSPETTQAPLSHHRWMAGKVVTAEPVMVVPNPNWVVDDERTFWRFAVSASLAVNVAERLTEPLYVTFTVDLGNPQHLHCNWNGELVPDSWKTVTADRLLIGIPAAALAPGVHSLTLIRNDPAGIKGRDKAFRFSSLHWRNGDRSELLRPGLIHFYQYIAGFLLQGVAGSYLAERLGGVLFVGPGRTRLPVEPDGPSELRFTLHNSSPGTASFTVTAGANEKAVAVESHQKSVMSIPIDPGTDEVLLQIAGPEHGLFIWGAPQMKGTTPPVHPPILLVTMDTTRRDVVPPYSADSNLMPNVAKLVDHATVYTRAVATSPWTLPTHSSIMTGLYPSHHRAGVTEQELTANNVTAPELLRRHGYLTGGFAGGFFCASRFGLSQGFAEYHDPGSSNVAGDEMTSLVLDFLDRYAESHPFLFVNYFDPHFPFQAPDRFRAMTGADRLSKQFSKRSIWRSILGGNGSAWNRANTRDIKFPRSALKALNAEYRAEVAFMDEQIGKVLQALIDQGIYDQSMIILVSDHGELLGEHRILGHGGRLTPELVEVPLIVKYPHQQEPVISQALVSVVDIFPTLLGVAGITPPPTDGQYLPGAELAPGVSRTTTFSEEHSMGIHRLKGRMKVADNLYGIEHPESREVAHDAGRECFTLGTDGWEPVDCQPGSPMDLVENTLNPPSLLAGQQETGLGEDEKEKLRALGYVQ